MTDQSTAGEPIPAPVTRAHTQSDTSVTRDHIIDRTGDLMHRAHEVAAEFRKAGVVVVEEPDTGTKGAIILTASGDVKALPSSVFDQYRDGPKRRAGTAVMTRLESFIAFTNRFKTHASAIFACDSKTKPSLTAVIDYHPSVVLPAEFQEADSAPLIDPEVPADFCEHRGYFGFPLSDEYQAWSKMDGQWMTMAEFAVFLEERFIDVEQIDDVATLNPDILKLKDALKTHLATPTKLLELSQQLVVLENATHVQAQNRYTGEGEIVVKNEHTDENGEKLALPKMFVINIPVFDRGDHWRIAARLRWNKSGGIKFIYDLWGIDRVFETAITEVCERARDETGLPLLYGAPEPVAQPTRAA